MNRKERHKKPKIGRRFDAIGGRFHTTKEHWHSTFSTANLDKLGADLCRSGYMDFEF